jgi:hypothetical protein
MRIGRGRRALDPARLWRSFLSTCVALTVALGLLLLVAFAPVRGAAAEPLAHAASACSKTITVWRRLSGIRQTASGIRTANVSCASGTNVVNTFLLRAGSNSSCLHNAEALTPGCAAAGYRCFLDRPGRLPYCAAPSRRSVQWRLSPASANCAIPAAERHFYFQITANARVTCDTAHTVNSVAGRTDTQIRHFRAAGREWTRTITYLDNYRRARTLPRSGNADVVVLSLAYS